MCGICGILGTTEGFAVSKELVTRMRDTMVHRGPDDGGSWYLPEHMVAFGHRRLSIVDLSTAGRQPMPNEDGSIWITYNGEVYNHVELRKELEGKGHIYRSNTDTETILHLYEEEGSRCVERLQGMFAFAIWDRRKRQMFLARDRIGIKPLYYARLPGGFVFGSEIKCLLEHPAVTPDLDENTFFHYTTFTCTPAPMTMFKGIRKLFPSERMTITVDGTARTEKYWSPMSASAAEEIAAMSEAEMEERTLELLRASIKKRMMADVPFGVFLSGGVDSSTNVALMSELTSDPVRTFSVAFKDQEKYNELDFARQVASEFRTDHHEVVLDVEDLIQFLPELVYHQDEPIADWVCVPLHFVAKLAHHNDTTVVQVGEGSDEIFHGYTSYIRHARMRRQVWEPLRHMPAAMRHALAKAASGLTQHVGKGVQYADVIVDAANDRLPFWGGAIAFKGPLKEKLLAPNGCRQLDSYDIVERYWSEAERELPGADLLQKMTFLELRQRLAELLLMRVDKMTMATSVEARVPFLDHDLVQFAVALPERMKVRDGVGKYVLKKAVEGVIPSNIVNRPKQGFGAPVAEWFRGEFGLRAQREIAQSSLAERGLLNYDYVDELWRRHRTGRGSWAPQLWNLYNVSVWHDYWIAGRELR